MTDLDVVAHYAHGEAAKRVCGGKAPHRLDLDAFRQYVVHLMYRMKDDGQLIDAGTVRVGPLSFGRMYRINRAVVAR